MAFALDHLVWAVPNLDDGVTLVRDALGVAPSRGGSHVGRGTANFLLDLGAGVYLEVIGPDVDQPTPDRTRPFGIDDLARPRLVTFAVRVRGIDQVIDTLRAVGEDPGPAQPMQRLLPGGGLLSWQLTERPEWAAGIVPFLIDWGESVHPSHTCAHGAQLERLRAAHPDGGRVRKLYGVMGLAVDVVDGPEASLEAVVTGPKGLMTLSG